MPRRARQHSAVSCAKTACAIEMSFGLWTRVQVFRRPWATPEYYAGTPKFGMPGVLCTPRNE